MQPYVIKVPLGVRSYSISIGDNLLSRLGHECKRLYLGQRCAVITDRNVAPHYGQAAVENLEAAGFEPTLITVPAGETAKSLKVVASCYDQLAEQHLERKSFVVALGGGVVGDLAGFVGATFLRGVDFVQVPTTLLAQVDSSVGGKVGVNLTAGKNLVGAFYPPALVVCDPSLLASLPRREFRSGLYEVVKYGVIRSRPLFDRLFNDLTAIFGHDTGLLTSLVAECCQIKADVVGQDERESGPRRILNFGHTIGHALEAVTRYKRFRHGEAIGYGMLAAAHISTARGLMSADDNSRLNALITHMGPLPPVADLNAAEVLDAVMLDKKVIGGRLHFVLAKGIGDTAIVNDVTTDELRAAVTGIGMPT